MPAEANEGDHPNLGDLINMQISQDGPMSVATYMALCLSHPRHGYYAVGEPIGLGGDFVTAPEISQIFGELIGFWLVNIWQQLGEPRSLTLLELGPGRGTLMADALRVATRAPGFGDALHLQLFESNRRLREEQARRLATYHPYWSETLGAVSDDPLLVVANEFFDALPIRQFVRRGAGWHERLVGLREGSRTFGLAPEPTPDHLVAQEFGAVVDGSIVETSPAASDALASLAAIISAQRGALLAIDYGYGAAQLGNTLQAVRRHRFADPLEAPGETDLSSHVDFGALRRVAEQHGLEVQPLTTQGAFLQRLGAVERAAALARANPAEADSIAGALRRLVAPEAMGDLFKVFGAATLGLHPLGFEDILASD